MSKMKLSRYFANLSSAYEAEIDDLKTDSEGNNVLKSRLYAKRQQMPELLPMISFAPEMVAVAFHGAFAFKNSSTIESLLTCEQNKLPSWSTVHHAVLIEPWARGLIDTVLADAQGDAFLVTTIGLEYLNKGHLVSNAPKTDEQDESSHEHEAPERRVNADEDDDEASYDLDEAGADWLAEQGFDRKE